MANKLTERAYLNLARSIYAEFPEGDPVDSESPDFLWPDASLGVEVRRLFQSAPNAGFPPSQIEGFRRTVVSQAERIYLSAGGPRADVIVNFSGANRIQQRATDLAGAIANFVRDHPRNEKQVTFFERGNPNDPLPAGLTGINVASPLPGLPRSWTGGGIGQTVLVTHELLSEAVREKDARVRSYREMAANVWLLVVCDLFPASMSFAVPDAIEEWEFASGFDRLLLMSRGDMKVWTLRRAQPCRARGGSLPNGESSSPSEANLPP